MISRLKHNDLEKSLRNYPVTAILGPRQCGKSTLAKELLRKRNNSLYLDLERPSDLQKLEDAEWFLSNQSGKLVCLDEIQRKPDLYPLLRSLVDETGNNGQFLILGSASRDLIKQSSESLTGRISYQKLTPFLWQEIMGDFNIETYLTRGGFPLSLLSQDDIISSEWRENFITTFLERDLLQFAGFNPQTMRRLWQMLAHYHGQTANYSALGSSLGVSHTLIRNYIDLLEGTFMVRQIPPWAGNTKKRIVKSPKVYISDSGITSALLNIKNFEDAAGHPVFGALWESVVIENILGHFPHLEYSYYRSSHGNEVDLVLSDRKTTLVIECKASLSPALSKGNYSAIEDISPEHTFIVIPAEKGYAFKKGIDVVTLAELADKVSYYFN